MEIEELTWREQEILALLASRLTNREIAHKLHLAESTVKDYVSNILGKLSVKNRRQAVVRGKELGLLDGERKEPAGPVSNLPAFTSPFVGRASELDAIAQYLGETRLLTISGLGGAGKTRLAVRAAKNAIDRYPHGVVLVSLAPLQTPDQIARAIAESVRFPLATSEEPVRQLIRYLRGKRLLLVLDNFEHLMEGASILEEILQAAPEARMLVTSRERLNLPGEVNFRIGGMEIADAGEPDLLPGKDAVELFVQTAGRTLPSFKPSAAELKQIAEICRAVGGIPLAIELAAAWLNALALDEIRAEIEGSFDFLSSETRAVPERHRSIRTVFDQTWDLLRPEDRQVLARISVFRGGFTRDAAREIAGAGLPALSSLVNRSVIRFEPAVGRYEVHELIRQYAFERLQSRPERFQAGLESHADYFADVMERKWDQLRDGRQMGALKEIDADIENFRAAWRFHIRGSNAVQIRKFISSFWLVYWVRGWNLEAVRLFGEAVESLEDQQEQEPAAAVRAHAMGNQAFFLAWLGEAEKGYDLAVESIRILEALGDQIALYFAYHGLTLPAYYLGKIEEEKKANNRMLEIAEKLDDKWLAAFGCFLLAITRLRTGDLPEAERLARTGLNKSSALQDLTVQVLSWTTLGHVANLRGEYEHARATYQKAVEAAGRLGFRWAIGNGTKYLGQVAVKSGEHASAKIYFLQSLNIANEHGLNREIANLFYEMANMRIAQERMEEGLEILGMLFELPESLQEHLGIGTIKDSAWELSASLEERLSSEAIEEYLNRGKELDPDVFIAELLEDWKN